MHLWSGFVTNKQMPWISVLSLQVIRTWDEAQSADCSKIKRKALKSLVVRHLCFTFKRTRCQLAFAFFYIKTALFKFM